MRKFLVALVLSAGLCLSGVVAGTAEAGKGGGSSGGRSVSFSSGSGGRSFSSGSSGGGRSYSSGASSSGRSYYSGPSSSKTTSGSSRPPVTSPPPRTNPASVSTKAGPTSPPASTNPNRPAAGSGKSYSSGTRLPAGTAATPSSNGAPAGRSYSSRNSSFGGKSYTTEPSSTKPSTGSFDANAARSQKMAESKVAFQKGQQPKESYTGRDGVTHTIDPKDRQIDYLRGQLNYERWQNRQSRQQQFFGPYYTYPVVVYHDPYSYFFWWWLLDQSLNERAYWAYHHRQSVDDARYRELLARDANLEARIHQLEAQNLPRDPTYRPSNMEPDLMYSNSYVEAVYNPQPPATARGHAVRAMIMVFMVFVLISLTIWFVFYKRWGSIGS